MKKSVKIALIIAILLAVASITTYALTGQVVIDKYNFTKAICDETNFCQDHLITCEGDTLLDITPITGATIQHDLDWIDPRGEQSDNYCE